jgi:glycosyltransferase involved in cell wall biosynthesis
VQVLIVTCAHRGDDARIVHRQARSLLEHGHAVVLVSAPPDDPGADPQGLVRVPIRRTAGRHRVGPWRDARRAIAAHLDDSDIVLLHDPELVAVVRRRWLTRRPFVWDVHEDFAASVGDRAWIPAPLASAVRRAVGRVQRRAVRRMHVVVAEASYRAFLPDAPFVPNSTWIPGEVPDTGLREPHEVVYVGRISAGRGVDEMIALGRVLGGDVRVVLVGPADGDVRDRLESAVSDGVVEWRGPLPNPEALAATRGAVAGLSLLRDEDNYRHSRPTKLIEYMAAGVPVITTPLPLAAEMVEESGSGVIVPFGDVVAVAEAARRLATDAAGRRAAIEAGHRYVSERHNWQVDGARFVTLLEGWARGGR